MPAPTTPADAPREARARLYGVLAIALLVILAYADGLRGPFVFDDASSISQNPTIRSFSPLWAPLSPPEDKGLTVSGRPILNLSFALDYALHGNAVFGYHLVNLAIHLCAAWTLFGLLRRLLAGPALRPRFGGAAGLLALAGAALWAVHPLMTEAVTYTVQRAESLVSLFYLLVLYATARLAGGASGKVWLPVGWLACLLGMGTKEIMVSAPVMALLLDRAFFAASFGEALRARWRLYLGLAASWIWLLWLVVGNGTNRGGSIGFGIGVGVWEHLLTQAPALATYARLLVWPSPLSINYDPTWTEFPAAAPAFVVIVLVIAASLVGWFRRPQAAFAVLLALAVLAPTSLMPAPSQFTCEHRMYLPAAALIALVVALAYRWLGRGSLWIWCLLVPLAAFATAQRNLDYRSEVSLWRDNAAKQPKDAITREMLAQAYDHANDRAAAIEQRELAVTLYHGPSAGLSVSECLLGQDLSQEGRPLEALPHFRRSLEIRPDYAEGMVFYGVALESAGRSEAAVSVLTRAVSLDPRNEEAVYNKATALAALGRHKEAIDAFRKALALKPDHYEAHFNLGNSLAEAGRHAEAIAEFSAALALRPSSSRAHYNLAGSYIALGRLPEAVEQLKLCVAEEPTFYDGRCNLAIGLEQTGRPREALEQYEAAQAINPQSQELTGSIRRLRQALGP